jgi:hypothetical protein
MDDKDSNLFGSDNEEENDSDQEPVNVKAVESREVDDEDEEPAEKSNSVVAAKEAQDSALFGSDDDDDNDSVKEAEANYDEDGEDGRSRFSSKQQDLDDLFGGNGDSSMFTAAPPVVKKVITVSKLCIPERIALPDPQLCMSIRMPNFVKIAPTCFEPEKLNVEEESKMMGMNSSLLVLCSLMSHVLQRMDLLSIVRQL